jgi:hypothetical protein
MALHLCPQLAVLNLACNRLKDPGLHALCHCLADKGLPSLTSLDISINEVRTATQVPDRPQACRLADQEVTYDQQRSSPYIPLVCVLPMAADRGRYPALGAGAERSRVSRLAAPDAVWQHLRAPCHHPTLLPQPPTGGGLYVNQSGREKVVHCEYINASDCVQLAL